MTDDAPMRAGVIGVGSMGHHHARVYDELAGVELVGVADVNEAQAREVAAEYGVTAMDQAELLDAVDLVSIAVPTQFHYPTARECIERGVDVLVEKPFVEDPADGRRLIELADERDVTLQVGHVERFNPAVQALEDVVDDLDVIAVTAQRLGPPLDRDIEDTAVMDLMIHDLDIVLSLVDADVEDVAAIGTRENRYATADIQFDDGTVGQLTASRVTQEKVRNLTISARECRVKVDYIDQSLELHRGSLPEYVEQNGDVRYRHENVVERVSVDSGEPLKRELRSFVDAARNGTEPEVTGEDGLRVLELVRHIDRQAAGEKRLAKAD
ncbi:Gfo/Idh/MocA family oxidoreductase [Halobacteriaceae archaeon GCM10025711]